MIVSMTGYGKVTAKIKNRQVTIEARSVNGKFLEISSRLPVIFSDKENEIKELISNRVNRGKISITLNFDKDNANGLSLKVNPENIKTFYNLLMQIKNAIGSKEKITIGHIMSFSQIFTADENHELAGEWENIKKLINIALDDLSRMKCDEGKILEKDIMKRINNIENKLDKVNIISGRNIKTSKKRLLRKVNELIQDTSNIDKNRLEYELILMSDKLDITEEIVRAKSHIGYFVKNVKSKEFSGRRLNFLLQELNREINTIASKSNSSKISQYVVEMKEEIERIREQLQNVE